MWFADRSSLIGEGCQSDSVLLVRHRWDSSNRYRSLPPLP